MMSPFLVLMWILSMGFTVLLAAALGTYVFRAWQKIRGSAETPAQDEILDHLDQMQAQLYSMSERLQRMERQMMLPPGGEGGEERADLDEG